MGVSTRQKRTRKESNMSRVSLSVAVLSATVTLFAASSKAASAFSESTINGSAKRPS